MALYLGSNRVKINLDGVTYHLNSNTMTSITNNKRLLSYDNYILKDINGIYLLPKIEINKTVLVTSDNYLLTDIDGLYLTFMEDE